jgi:Asp-tRNA(Asn)/Glu-tRNA(Gln) amidotransferase C subunit
MEVRDLDKVEPLYHVVEIELPLRDDEPLDRVDIDHELLSGNAILENGYIKAPKTIGE